MIRCDVPPDLHLTSVRGSAGLSWLMTHRGKEPRLSGGDCYSLFKILSFYAYLQGLAPGVKSANCFWKASVLEQAPFLHSRTVIYGCFGAATSDYEQQVGQSESVWPLTDKVCQPPVYMTIIQTQLLGVKDIKAMVPCPRRVLFICIPPTSLQPHGVHG